MILNRLLRTRIVKRTFRHIISSCHHFLFSQNRLNILLSKSQHWLNRSLNRLISLTIQCSFINTDLLRIIPLWLCLHRRPSRARARIISFSFLSLLTLLLLPHSHQQILIIRLLTNRIQKFLTLVIRAVSSRPAFTRVFFVLSSQINLKQVLGIAKAKWILLIDRVLFLLNFLSCHDASAFPDVFASVCFEKCFMAELSGQ